MKKQLFKLLFGALFLVGGGIALTGCSDDDEKAPIPQLNVSDTALTFTTETEMTQTFDVKANCEWQVQASGLEGWATITPLSGSGNATVSVSVSDLISGSREGKIQFMLIHSEFGKWGLAEQAVVVKQLASAEAPSEEAIYFNNFDKAKAEKDPTSGYYPYLDQSDCWQNHEGTGSSTVVYDFNSMSVRSNQASNSQYSDADYLEVASGVNNVMAGNGGWFVIKDITLPAGKTDYVLTFGVMGEYQTAFAPSMCSVEISKDGSSWVPVTYTRSDSQNWGLATAKFSLKSAVEKLSIRFTPCQSGRLDDVKLLEGVGGQEIDLDAAPEAAKVKIGQIKEKGLYETEGTVVARGLLAYIIADETGAMMVYHKDNERAVGEKIAISGEVTVYNAASTPQFSADAAVTVLSTGNSWNYNPTEMDAAAMDALLEADPVCKEIRFTGKLSISGNYVNVEIPGAAKAIGSVKYVATETMQELDGKNVVVTGYFIGTSSGKYCNVLPYEVTEAAPSSKPEVTLDSEGLAFPTAGGELTVNVTTANAEGCTLEAAADNDHFKVSVKDNVVTVTAAANTTGAPIQGKLTVRLMKDGASVAAAAIELTQAAETAKIGDIRDAGFYMTEGTVVARGVQAYVIADGTGAMLVYHKNNERTVGEKITISGEVTIYNSSSTPQFSAEAVVNVVSTGNSWSYNPTVMDAAAMDALLDAAPVCKEIQFSGKLSISGNYMNVEIPGAAKATGSVKYVATDTMQEFDGKNVVVKGYFVGTSSGKYCNVLPYEVTEGAPSTQPELQLDRENLAFMAEGGELTVNVTTTNAEGCTLEAAADNDHFTVAVNGDAVTVKAAANTTSNPIKATLTVKLVKDGAAVATGTVEMTQEGVQTGNDTKGTFTSMEAFVCTKDNSANAIYTLGEESTINGKAATGIKFGTSSKTGLFTSEPLGVTGTKKLSFYAVAWKGKTAKIYVRVNGGGAAAPGEVELTANDGATGNMPYTIEVTDADYYTFELTGLTAESTVSISTSPAFEVAADKASSRAVVAGIQLY